jgi:hypothetical protein
MRKSRSTAPLSCRAEHQLSGVRVRDHADRDRAGEHQRDEVSEVGSKKQERAKPQSAAETLQQRKTQHRLFENS